MIARTREGHELLAFVRCDEPIVPAEDAHIPLTFTLVVARYQERYLLIFDTTRDQWEIPGGGIERGETPQDCARRELFEESSQIAERLSFRGLFKFRMQPDQNGIWRFVLHGIDRDQTLCAQRGSSTHDFVEAG